MFYLSEPPLLHCFSLLSSSTPNSCSLAIADWSRNSHLTLVEPIRALPWKIKEKKSSGERNEDYVGEEYRLGIKRISMEFESLVPAVAKIHVSLDYLGNPNIL